MSEIRTDAIPTFGEMAFAVFSSPNTTHGCRPISVKIHPEKLATNGKTIAKMPARRYQRDFSKRFWCHNHRPTRLNNASKPPIPTMMRNDQYVKATFGI